MECNLCSRKASDTAAKPFWMSMAKSECRVYAAELSLIAVSTVQGALFRSLQVVSVSQFRRGEIWSRNLAFISDSHTRYPG